MTVNGTSFMQLTLTAATKLADDGSLTYTGPTNFEPGFPQLVQLIERGDFEAVNSWYLGLNGGDCITGRRPDGSEPDRDRCPALSS